MNTKEYKQLTYSLVPALQEHFRESKDNIVVKILQDTMNQQVNPFNPPALIIGVGYKDTGVMEIFQVTNNGDDCAWQFQGQARV